MVSFSRIVLPGLALALSVAALGGCASAGLGYSETSKVQAQTDSALTIRYYSFRASQTEIQAQADAIAAKVGKKAVFVNTVTVMQGSGGSVLDGNFNLVAK